MLTDPMLSIRLSEGVRMVTIQQAFARLCRGHFLGFEGLTAHQQHGWDLFCYQLAAMALTRSAESAAVDDDAAWRALDDADEWAQRLRALAPEAGDDAWSLVVDDLRRPALLQPPIPSGTLQGYSLIGRFPDEIDVLVTSKGHDVKPARAAACTPLSWLFALVTLQTMQGYSGRGNFGVARMNGGFGSRPLLMASPSRDVPARFRRGVQAALAARKAALDLGAHYAPDGRSLLWLEPWDSEVSLPLAELDPLFVEICRRVRLVRNEHGRIEAWGRPSEVPRVAVPKASGGDLGDAWTPTLDGGGAALTVGAGGFNYRLMTRLINGEFTPPPAMWPPPGQHDEVWLQAAVLVRGQGKTEGLHERWLPVPGRAYGLIGRRDPDVGRIAKEMVENAGTARDALRWGVLTFLQGGADKPDGKDERPREWLERLEAEVDRIFFPHLFARLEGQPPEDWLRNLCRAVEDVFDQAITRLTSPDQRREKARVVAEQRFGFKMKDLRPDRQEVT